MASTEPTIYTGDDDTMTEISSAPRDRVKDTLRELQSGHGGNRLSLPGGCIWWTMPGELDCRFTVALACDDYEVLTVENLDSSRAGLPRAEGEAIRGLTLEKQHVDTIQKRLANQDYRLEPKAVAGQNWEVRVRAYCGDEGKETFSGSLPVRITRVGGRNVPTPPRKARADLPSPLPSKLSKE